jgi:uncharacterized protein YneF (UPF0154 family)
MVTILTIALVWTVLSLITGVCLGKFIKHGKGPNGDD